MNNLNRTAMWVPIVAGCLIAASAAPAGAMTLPQRTDQSSQTSSATATETAAQTAATKRGGKSRQPVRAQRATAAPVYELKALHAKVPGTTGGWSSNAAGMSSNGLVVGTAFGASADGQSRTGVFVADRNGVRRWATASARSGCTLDSGVDVTSGGAVLGFATCGQQSQVSVVVDTRGQVRRLPVPRGLVGLPEAINDRGDVIGRVVSNDRGSTNRNRAYWPAGGGVVVHDAKADFGASWGLSNTGVVVGNASGKAAWSRGSAALDKSVGAASVTAYGGGISPNGANVVANRGGESVLLPWGQAARPLVPAAQRFQAEQINDSGRVLGSLLDAGNGPGIVQGGVLYNLKDIARGVPAGSVLLHRDLAGNGDVSTDLISADWSTTEAAILVAR
ncbi:hypothetical protein BJY21_000383 [Kineosphaera limosa]|uniref:Uncharacterized protein n=1 Tax=Kineosphaera limosa NBRC 100340 TaxID=1184609 RepID=K6WWA8_9MICO|nr:hypothetical protein [Kineosphaera limosa]NYD99198.1 hypothetical protein [Kineosphaera limosa]GAB96362.1 hypothetical protein KILIM_035_00510 [Kineosphaera limosa NBRC 100340]